MIQKLATSLSGILDRILLDWHFKHANAINSLIDLLWTDLASIAAGGGTYTLPPGSGMLVVNDTTVDGRVGLYSIGGGNVVVAASPASMYVSGAPAAGEIGVSWTGSANVITNNTVDDRVLSLLLVKSRAAN